MVPRFDDRWPPVCATECSRKSRSSRARTRSSPRSSSRRSAGLSMRSSRGYISAVRCVIQSASSTSRRDRVPNGTSAARASSRSASACRLASARPSSATYVGLFCAASLPAVLPSEPAEPSTSSTSSTTWKASPAARANLSSAVSSLPSRARPHDAPSRIAARMIAPGLHAMHRGEVRQRHRLADVQEIDRLPARHAGARPRPAPGAPIARTERSIANACACSASPARSAIASPNATWQVGLPRRRTSSSMHGRSSCASEYAWIISTAAAGPSTAAGIGLDELARGVGEQRTNALAAAQHRVAHGLDEPGRGVGQHQRAIEHVLDAPLPLPDPDRET